jgi:hypothetical protein
MDKPKVLTKLNLITFLFKTQKLFANLGDVSKSVDLIVDVFDERIFVLSIIKFQTTKLDEIAVYSLHESRKFWLDQVGRMDCKFRRLCCKQPLQADQEEEQKGEVWFSEDDLRVQMNEKVSVQVFAIKSEILKLN